MFREKEKFKLQMFIVRSWISIKYNLVTLLRKMMTGPRKKNIWTRWIVAEAIAIFSEQHTERLFL